MKKLVVVFFTLAFVSITTKAQELSMNAKLLTVYNLVGSEQYALALFQIDEILAEDSTIVNAYIFGGLCYQNLGDKSDALFYYDKALILEPENADVHYLKGECLFELKEIMKAKASFVKCLDYQGDYYKAFIELAKIDQLDGQFVEAEKKLVHVIQNQVYNLEARKELAKVLLTVQDTALALNVISQALMIRPDDKEALIFRIGLLYNLEIYEGMLYDLDKYISMDDSDSEMYLKRGKAHLFTGDTISSLRDFNDALFLNPEAKDAYYYRAITRHALFDQKGACEDIMEAEKREFLPDKSLVELFCKEE